AIGGFDKVYMHLLHWEKFRQAALTCLGILAASVAQAQTSKSGNVALYAAVGPELVQYDVNVETAVLTRRGSVTLPDNVQYAWPQRSTRCIYVAWSTGAGSDHHGVSAFRIEPLSGALQLQGAPVSLPSRPVHVTTDIPGTHLLVAYNDPSGLAVYGLAADG